jgi:hypothetical protein
MHFLIAWNIPQRLFHFLVFLSIEQLSVKLGHYLEPNIHKHVGTVYYTDLVIMQPRIHDLNQHCHKQN